MLISIIFSIITVLSVAILIIKLKSDNLDFYNTKIIVAEKELQQHLEKKLSILSELQQKLSSQTDETNFNLLCDIEEIKDDDFMLNAILNKASREVKRFLDDRRAYIPDDETKVLLNNLHEVDIKCIALKDYYNNNSIILNNLIKKFPDELISKFKKIYKKELYNDPIEEEFEILKKK